MNEDKYKYIKELRDEINDQFKKDERNIRFFIEPSSKTGEPSLTHNYNAGSVKGSIIISNLGNGEEINDVVVGFMYTDDPVQNIIVSIGNVPRHSIVTQVQEIYYVFEFLVANRRTRTTIVDLCVDERA